MEKLFKVCNGCHKQLEANSDNFYKKIRGKYGFYAVCKQCQNVRRMKSYYKKHQINKDRLLDYYNNNKEIYQMHAQHKIQTITDAYIRNKIKRKNISDDLMRNKGFLSVIREQIKIKRLIKNKQL